MKAADKSLPTLLDRNQIAEKLGVKVSTAENIMRKVPKVKVGRRVFVRDSDIRAYLEREATV